MVAHAAVAAVRETTPEFDTRSRVANLRVAIAHDWLVRYAGSERVVGEILRMFPDARLFTTMHETDALPEEFAAAETSFLQKIPGATSHHEWLLPLMPLAWRFTRAPEDVDVVISSSHACAKALRAPRGVPHICYCHTPMRYAWDFDAERRRFPRAVRLPARALMAGFRRWDVRAASAVTRFVANSSAVARRVRHYYGRDADVVHPPVRTDFFTPGGERADFFLYVGRLVSYKSAELVVRTFAELPHELIVVGRGHLDQALRRIATPNVTFVPSVDDGELRDLYRRARALVFPADEDFGIAMVEAQACGTPVIGLAGSGADDIVVPGVTGWLLEDQTVPALRRVIRDASARRLDEETIASHAARFSAGRFRDQLADVIRDHVTK